MQHLGAFLVGIVVGFLGGLFGKGGSAIATPLLSLVGYPGFIAVASPLPATIPGTLIAFEEYRELNLFDRQIILWSIAVGVPATILGSYLTLFTGARPLLILTGLLVLGFGITFLISPKEKQTVENPTDGLTKFRPSYWRSRLFLIATAVGIVSGLLANAGGFLLAPAYARFLAQPLKKAFASSLAVSAALAVPGTIVHAHLGHISWTVAGLVALGSVPFSYLGARVAIRTGATRLERAYGLALTALGAFFLFHL
ncbi:MAG TPA: sulfite exporter TauE/SafE family protein [Candidatus Acidoferrales bacterium]|nr:sulfite exporter TauE/SafE family protein [Candidatus Acidoferrales bacterium]